MAQATPPPPPQAPENSGTQLILQQLAAMQEVNRREFARIESEAQTERVKMQTAHRETTESLRAAISRMQETTRPHATPLTPVTQPAEQIAPIPSTSRAGPSILSQNPSGAAVMQSTTNVNPNQPTLEGQPPQVTITPADLAEDSAPSNHCGEMTPPLT